MLDWLRYFPLAFRIDSGPVIPRGPYFPKLRVQRWVVGDSVFRFKAPWTHSIIGAERYRETARSRGPGGGNILDCRLRSESDSVMPNDRWQVGRFYEKWWFFSGPWFARSRATFKMYGEIIGQKKRSDYQGSSFFHPRVFESAISDYLNSYYGHERVRSKPLYRGPLNWKSLPISPSVYGASFDIHQIDMSVENPRLTRHLIFPVSHDRIVSIVFDFGDVPIGNVSFAESKVDSAPLFNLNDSIVETFSLEVGPTMQAQWDEIKAQCPDMSLTDSFGELKWPIKPEDVGKTKDTSEVEKYVKKTVEQIAQQKQ